MFLFVLKRKSRENQLELAFFGVKKSRFFERELKNFCPKKRQFSLDFLFKINKNIENHATKVIGSFSISFDLRGFPNPRNYPSFTLYFLGKDPKTEPKVRYYHQLLRTKVNVNFTKIN